MTLGVSLYFKNGTQAQDFAYLELAASLGFQRIFTCLLSADSGDPNLPSRVRAYTEQAHRLHMRLAVDVNAAIFSRFGATPENLHPFHAMGVDVLRLDDGFSEEQILTMMENRQGLQIEINASAPWGEPPLCEFLSRLPRSQAVLTCHNFYPLRHTGLDEPTVRAFTEPLRAHGVRTAAFVSSQRPDAFGPWPLLDGLCTMECCRDWTMEQQARYLQALRLFDDLLVANTYADEEELRTLSKIDQAAEPWFDLVLDTATTPQEQAVINELHTYRLDGSEQITRSSRTRKHTVPARKTTAMFHPGDVALVNANIPHYEGEVLIFRTETANDGNFNYVGSLSAWDQNLLRLLPRGANFRFHPIHSQPQ